MGVRILSEGTGDMACLYCSTSEVAFGPIFHTNEHNDGDERAEAFLRWIDSDQCDWNKYASALGSKSRRDARLLTDLVLMQAYADWLVQEAEQIKLEEQHETASE